MDVPARQSALEFEQKPVGLFRVRTQGLGLSPASHWHDMGALSHLPKMGVIRLQNTGSSILFLKIYISQAPVAHGCNPSYSGGRDQKDHGSKPAWANSSRDPISKIFKTKWEWLKW
jgi:hypothetical protein